MINKLTHFNALALVSVAHSNGGLHPRFGTRNFTLSLQNSHYLEVVYPNNHSSSDSTSFGRIVSQRAAEGGVRLTGVVATDDVLKIEKRLGRAVVDGLRTKPDGKDLAWKQIGVLGTTENSNFYSSLNGFCFIVHQ